MRIWMKTALALLVAAAAGMIVAGQPSVDPLIECLKDKDFVVRCHAARALGGMTTDYQIGRTWVRDAKVVDGLIAALKDPDRAVREDATIALGQIGDPRAIDALIEAMKDGVVKRHAIASLGMIGDPRALPPVLDALKGKGIRQDGTPTPGCIVSEDAFIKEAAATALGQFRDPRVIPDLIMLLKDGVLREKAGAALATIGDTAIGKPVGRRICAASASPIARSSALLVSTMMLVVLTTSNGDPPARTIDTGAGTSCGATLTGWGVGAGAKTGAVASCVCKWS